jgi:hypothetical protein
VGGVTIRCRGSTSRSIVRSAGPGAGERLSGWMMTRTSDSNDSRFQQSDSSCCQRENPRKDDHSKDAPQHEDIHLYDHTHVQQNEGAESTHEATPGDDGGACVSDVAVTQNGKIPDHE